MQDIPPTVPYLDSPRDESVGERHQTLEAEARQMAFISLVLRWLHRHLFYFLFEAIDWFHDHIYPGYTFPSPEGSMACMVHCEVMADDRINRSYAKALIDTGNPLNLMSRTLASRLGIKFSAVKGDPVLITPGNDTIRSVGKVRLRWTTNNIPPNSRFSFYPKYYEDVFYVLEKDEECFEMIIGSDTILKHRFAKWKLPLGASGRRYNPPKLDSKSLPTS